MNRLLWWSPFLGLVLVAGIVGYQIGKGQVVLDETQVISRIANAHLEERGGRAEDCFAVPGSGGVWLQVVCSATVYKVDHRGRVIAVEEPGA